MTIIFIILFLSSYSQISYSAPSGMRMALVYLSNYGYLEANMMEMNSSNNMALRKGIKEFQSFMKLPATGNLNHATMKLMTMPRCGVKDNIGKISKRIQKYSTKGGRWNMMLLRYKIVRYPKTMKKIDVDITIEKALNAWSAHTNIMFEPATNRKIDIIMKFVKGKHGDDSPFTGPGGVVAHANFPALGGDIHFDDYETWTINSVDGTNLLQVAMHEIGHSLGLTHSDEYDAVMCPITRDYIPDFMLHQDDIKSIQDLYGRVNKSMRVPSLPEDPPEEEWELSWDEFENVVDNN